MLRCYGHFSILLCIVHSQKVTLTKLYLYPTSICTEMNIEDVRTYEYDYNEF